MHSVRFRPNQTSSRLNDAAQRLTELQQEGMEASKSCKVLNRLTVAKSIPFQSALVPPSYACAPLMLSRVSASLP
jgi:hypothetical protein